MGLDSATIQKNLSQLKILGDELLRAEVLKERSMFKQLSAWMINAHCEFSPTIVSAKGNLGNSTESFPAISYHDDGNGERPYFQIVLEQMPHVFPDSMERLRVTKADRGLNLHIKNAMTFLVLARRRLDVLKTDEKRGKQRSKLLALWERCVTDIPSGIDDTYRNDMARYCRSFAAAREALGLTRSVFVKKRNRMIPSFLLSKDGQTPGLRFVTSRREELGRVDPITGEDGVMPHNQDRLSAFPAFARRTVFMDSIEVFGLSSKSRFHSKKPDEQRREAKVYYQSAIDAANKTFGKLEHNLLSDLTGSEFYRGAEATGRKRRQEIRERAESEAPIEVAAIPFVEFLSGSTVPLGRITEFDDIWHHPLLALVKKELWDRSPATEQLQQQPILQHFVKAVQLWQGHLPTEGSRKDAIYEEIHALARIAYHSKNSDLAAFLLMLLRYHFQQHDYWRFFDAWMAEQPVSSRYSKKYALKTAAKWVGVLGGVALLTVLGVNFTYLLSASLVVLPVVILVVGILLGVAKHTPKPPPLLSEATDPVSQLYSALIVPGRYGATCLAFLARLLGPQGLRHWAHCQSAKDRFSRYLLLLVYVSLCLKIKTASQLGKPIDENLMTYQLTWFAQVIRHQLFIYAGVDGIMKTKPVDDFLLFKPGEKSPYKFLFDRYQIEEKALESVVPGDRRVGAPARNWAP